MLKQQIFQVPPFSTVNQQKGQVVYEERGQFFQGSHPIASQVPKEAQMEAFQPAPAGMAKVRMGQKTDLPGKLV